MCEEITTVSKLYNGYRINDKVIICNLLLEGDKMTYELYWDSNKITEENAYLMANKFLSSALEGEINVSPI